MRKLGKKLLRPLKRPSKNHPESGQGSGVATDTPEESSSVQGEINREKQGLFELVSFTPHDDFALDIVAVHGLSGDWESTWTDPDSGNLWLRDFLPSQFPSLKLRIWSFGYDSAIAFTNSVADIDDAAKALVNALDGERQTENSKRKPIIFIAHSLGGIIVKRAMNLANERSDLWRDIVDSVFGIIFFAVPHRGADAASLATVTANVYTFATLGFAGNKNFVEALKRNSPEFWQISNAFIQPASRVGIIRSFYETTKIANDLIVDKDSASLGLNNERATPIQGANHRDICKFSSDGSQKFRPVTNAMRDIVEAALATEDITNEEDAFLDALCFPHMLDGLRYKQDSEHHQWLFHHNTFQGWVRNRGMTGHSRLLWVTGTPGSGKSTAIRGAYHRFLEDEDVLEGTHHIAAFCFEKNDETLLRSPIGMYRSLLYQILRGQKRIVGDLIKRRGPELSGGGERELEPHSGDYYRNLLLEVLREACRLSQRITILIDALDECENDDGLAWDAFFHNIVTSDDFRALNICLCSRHFGAARWLWLRPIRAVDPTDATFEVQIPVIEVEVANHSAIRGYLDEQLRVYSSETAELVVLKEEILIKSSGVFLWVTEILDRLIEDLRGHRPARLQLRLQPTPRRLQELYAQILDAAEEPLKTWRFLQWLFLAPDLSLQAWRDLIPFLQEKAPRSFKEGRKSKDWASGSSNPAQDDWWVLDLRQIVCRISLGLAQVAVVSETHLKVPAGDRHSIAGEAGSWHTADGDMRLVRPVHESLTRFLKIESGFHTLEIRTDNPYGEGLVMAMDTCLDFIKAREFSTLSVVSGGDKDVPRSKESTASLLSDGDASARTSVSRFSSARSMAHKAVHNIMSYSMGSSGSLSAEDLDLDDRENHTTAVLAHLINQEAECCPESFPEKRFWIERWRESVGNEGDFSSTPCPSVAPSFQLSARSLKWEIWSSEFLTYLLTAFPKFAQSAEDMGIDSSLIVMRLREGGLWGRWLFLSEQTPKDTTLKQWAESQRLRTWVRYLARTRENPYSSQSLRVLKNLGHSKLVDHAMNINYCFDNGDWFVKQPGLFSVSRSVSLNSIRDGLEPEDIEERLSHHLEINSYKGWPLDTVWHGPTRFIPYKSLRAILTESVVAELLEKKTKLAPQKAQEVRESYIKVLGTLIDGYQVHYINTLVEESVNDACLPLTFSQHRHAQNPPQTSRIFEKDKSEPGAPPLVARMSFENSQRYFLSPFLAQPARQLQHYKLSSFRTPLPIIRHDRSWGTHNTRRYENDVLNKVQFPRESFDFGEYGVETEAPGSSGWFVIRSLKGVTWERFLSIVNACRLASEREDQEPGVLPLLCTCEHSREEDSSKSEYHLIFPSPRDNLKELCRVDPTRAEWSAQLTERWLVSQCSHMATTLSRIHHIAAIKMPHLPRFIFLRSGRLASDMVYRISSSNSQLGTLVLGNLRQDPPGLHESAPEYCIASNRPSQSANPDLETLRSYLTRRSADFGAATPAQQISKVEDAERLVDAVDRDGTTQQLHASLEAPSPTPRHTTPEDAPMDPSIASADKNFHQGRSSRISASKFHVWCLATIWLRLITWFILGPEAVHSSEPPSIFNESSENPSTSGFFEELQPRSVDTNDLNKLYRLNPVVEKLMDKLQRHKSCTVIVKQLLTLMRERMLVIDVAGRASSQELKDRMDGITRNLENLEKTADEVGAA